jgi:hypothetical protein
VPRFLAEAYLAAGQMASLVQIVDRLDTSTLEQLGVRRLATVYVASDETCLHMFDADRAEHVAGACRTADVTIDRVSPAIYISGREPHIEHRGDLTLEPDPRRTP